MGIFDFLKKKEKSTCCCSSNEPAKEASCCSSNEPTAETSCCCSDSKPVVEIPCCSGSTPTAETSCCSDSTPAKEEKVYNENGEEMAMCDCGSMCKVSDIEAKKAAEKLAKESVKAIKVLGPGCKKCVELEKNTKEALSSMGDNSELIHVTDYAEIAAYGVMNTPALVVDGKVVSMGKVLKKNEIVELINSVRK